MSPDSLTQIDLSQNIEDQETTLSPEQQESFQNYLDNLQGAEKEGIIYLTKQELDDLNQIIAIPMPDSQNMSYERFVRRQRQEGLDLSDVISLDNTIPDIIKDQIEAGIDGFEETAQEKLFGENGIFKNLDISPTAQDHMSVSMSMSFVENGMNMLQQKIDSNSITQKDIEDFISMGADLENKLADIKSVADMNLPIMGSPKQIHIKSNGEFNKIFMDPSSGIDFFNGIISGKITSENIEETMEAGNVESAEDIQVDLEAASRDLNESILRMSQSISNMYPQEQAQLLQSLAGSIANNPSDVTGGTGTTETSPAADPGVDPGVDPEAAETPAEKNFIEKLLEMLKKILEGIIDFGDETDPVRPVTETEAVTRVETQDILATIKASLLSKLTQGAFTGMQESSLREFFSNDGQIQVLTEITNDIPTLGEQDKTQEKLENLFFTPIQSDENTMKIDAFVTAGSLETYKNADGSLNSESLLGVLRAYTNYRLAYSEDTNLSYEAYFTNMSE